MRRVLVWLIWLYQRTLSRVLPPMCRYHPSCSEYARQAIELHGAMRGSWLGFRRVLRCHPFAAGGDDPVPGTDDPVPGTDDPVPGAPATECIAAERCDRCGRSDEE